MKNADLAPTLPAIECAARTLLDMGPCPVVEYRLRRDVLIEDLATPRMRALRQAVEESSGAFELAQEQKENGSWGRFHSQDSSIRARFVTSERAIERALALGLDVGSPVLARAAAYMAACLRGEADWSDREEKAEAWFEGKRVITAAMLSLLDPLAPEVTPVWELWLRLAEHALDGGSYSLVRENLAFRRLTGVAFRHGYLRSVYALTLLGSRGREIPPPVSQAIVRWIWGWPEGIGYLVADMRRPNPLKLESWVKSLEVLSGFPGWQSTCGDALAWLWERRLQNGLWDFGHGMRPGFGFPLSDNWIPRGNRMIDHSTRILALLRKSVD